MAKRLNILVFNGRFLEVPSILEFKTELEEDDWHLIISQTVEFYVQMYVAHKSFRLDKHDLRIMRQLKRSLEIIKTLDPTTYSLHMNPEKVEQYHEMVEDIRSSLHIKYGAKGGPQDDSDITVSAL